MLSPTTKAAFEQAYTAWRDASNVYANIQQEVWTKERWSAARRLENTRKALRQRHVQCAMEFGRSRGLRWHPLNDKTVRALKAASPGFSDWWGEHLHVDHPDVFFRDGRVAAVVTHSYAPLRELERYAAEHGLLLEPLPWSWYSPGGTTAALLSIPTKH